MWLATEKGFYSVVKNHFKTSQKDELIIRSRKKTDLVNLNTGKKIITSKNKDYAYRIFVSRKEFKKLMTKFAEELEYTNFKDHIKELPDQKDKISFYSEVWATMNEYQGKFIQGLYNFRLRNYVRAKNYGV